MGNLWSSFDQNNYDVQATPSTPVKHVMNDLLLLTKVKSVNTKHGVMVLLDCKQIQENKIVEQGEDFVTLQPGDSLTLRSGADNIRKFAADLQGSGQMETALPAWVVFIPVGDNNAYKICDPLTVGYSPEDLLAADGVIAQALAQQNGGDVPF